MPEQEERLEETLSKLLRIAIRRRWWILIPASVIALTACLTSLLLPSHYTSEATILVEPQQVPERYVAANTTVDIRDALLVMTEAILSRTQLLRVMNEYGLYPKERGRLSPEQLVDLMRRNIEIEPLLKRSETKDLNAFKISFTGVDPYLSQEVARRLTTLFIEENLKSREEQSTGTTKFLADELETAATELKQQESRVRDFKMRYLGELPEQQQGNLTILAGLQTQLQNTMTTLGRAREQRVYLQSLLSQYDNLPAVPGATQGTTSPSPTETMKAELIRLQNERADLLARFTPKYPDVARVEGQIKQMDALLAASKEASETGKEAPLRDSSKSALPAGRDTNTAQLKSQLNANQLEIQNATKDAARIGAQIAEYQRRLNLTPVREQQLADLLRGYSLSKQHYDDLLNKKTQSELATSLERRQQGQRFRIIDPPNLPVKPSSPNHVKISLFGLAAGIAVGVALAFLVEARDHSLRDENELGQLFSFPLLVGVPTLLSEGEKRRRSRLAALEGIAAVTLCLLICAAEVYIYRWG